MGDTAAAWHVLMPPRGARISYCSSEGGARWAPELDAGFDPDGTFNAQIADKAATTFWSYDADSKGLLDRADLVSALGDMGALQGLLPKTIADTLALDSASNRDKRFTLHEFLTMYMRLAQLQAKLGRAGRAKGNNQALEPPPDAENSPALRQVFGAYCQFARGTSRMMMSDSSPAMVAQQLHRLTQDIGLVGEGGPLYSSSVDIAYVRCKTPGSHRLNYTQWLKVLCILSDESGWDLFQLLMEHAYKLGTKGLPPPVDPQTMLPPKPDAQVAPLPQLRHSASATEVRQPRGSGHSGFGLDADGPTLWTQTMPAPGNGGAAAAGQQPFQGRPSSGVSQRPPRFNNLMPAGNLRDSWSPPGAERAAAALSDPIARSLSGERSWNALELGQLDPNCLPPWLAQVLERLQFMEARAMGQQPQGNRVRTYPYRPGRDGAAGVAGADESDAVCALQDTVQDLQRQLQAQRADSDALQRRLQQLEAKAGDGGDGGGGGEYAAAGTAGAEWEARLVRCEARLDDHDVNLARLRASSSQPLESRVTDVEHQLKTFSVSLLATATSAASAAESAGQALSRVEGLERRLAEGAVTGSGSGVSPEVVAAATRSAPSQQQLLSMGLEPRVAEQVGRLPGLGLDANVWAELLKRLANAQEDTRQVDERLKRLISNPAQVAAASRPSSSGMPSPAVQQMLAAGMEPRVVEQLSKLEALGVDPSPFAVVMSRQAATEEGLKAFATNPAAAAAAAQKVLSAGSPSPAQQQLLAAGTDPMVTEQLAKLEALGVDPLLIADLLKKQASMEKELAKLAKNPVLAAVAAAKKGGKPPMAKEQQMVVAGVQPKVAEQLAKLEAFGLDPLLFADLVKRQRDTEQALGRLIKNPAATAAAAAAEERAANGGTPATADQDAVKAGLDAKAVDELRKLEALGVDPAVFADVMQRLGRTEQALEGLLHSPAGSAAASKQASGAGSSVAEQQMLAAGIEPQLAAELAKLGAIGVDPLPLAGVIQKQWDTEQAVGRLLKNPAAAVVAAAAAERGAGAAGPSPAQKQLLDTGVEPAVVEELGKLEALGVSPGVLGSLIRRVGDSERAVDQLMQGPAGAATAAVAAKKAAGGALTPVEQAMVAEGLDSKVAEQLAKLEVVGMDPLLFADLVKRVNVAIEAAQRVGAEAAQRTEALTAFAEALAAKHDALVSEVKGIRDVVAAAGDGTSKLGDLTQLAITIAELGGRCTAMERDLAMALTSYARIVDLKESENHVLDRHQQLHDEIETLKDNLRAVNDDIEQLTAAVVVAAPSITNTQALPGLIKQSVIVQASPSSGNIQRPSTAAGSTTSPLASSTSSAVLPAPGLPSQY